MGFLRQRDDAQKVVPDRLRMGAGLSSTRHVGWRTPIDAFAALQRSHDKGGLISYGVGRVGVTNPLVLSVELPLQSRFCEKTSDRLQ
jgi:hypothetical protein